MSDSYLPAIWRELRVGSVESLADDLHGVATNSMGLAPSEDGHREAAARLFGWWAARRA